MRWGKRAQSGKVSEWMGKPELGSHGMVKCTAAAQPYIPQSHKAEAVWDIRGAGYADTVTVAAKVDSAVTVKDSAPVVWDSHGMA